MGEDAAVKVGVIGCGKISDIYLENCSASEDLEVVACADLDEERAREKAAQYGVPRSGGVADLLEGGGVDVVLNLTVPQAHHTVSLAALRGGSPSTRRSRSPSSSGTPGGCSRRPGSGTSGSAAPPTPFSAAACRPAASL